MKASKKTLKAWLPFMVVLFALLVFTLSHCSSRAVVSHNTVSMTFDGPSTGLKRTEILATLDTPMTTGKNAIWCASFLAAWKALENDLSGEPVLLDGNPEIGMSLNKALDPRPLIPSPAIYSQAGWVQSNVLDEIAQHLHSQFPGKALPAFPGIVSNSFVAYAYLEATVKFSPSYHQNPEPLFFIDGGGNRVEINSFGFSSEDSDFAEGPGSQARILFWNGSSLDASNGFEFAIDLCATSSPSQVIVAKINRPATLADALALVEMKSSEWSTQMESKHEEKFGPADTLIVPDIYWCISHHYAGLEHRSFVNRNLQGQSLDVAQQDICFQLNKSGAQVRSEAKEFAASPARDFILDRPFLVCIKERGAQMPYFAMWVDNAELLSPWKPLLALCEWQD